MAETPWNDRPVEGAFDGPAGNAWYRIRNVDRMPPFLTMLASDTDHWLFASSLGPLTCGRKNARSALFPYTTDDKLHDAVDVTGSRTIVHVEGEPGPPWEPWSRRGLGVRRISRDLARSPLGDALRYEEHEHDLGLSLRTSWSTHPSLGVMRTVSLHNRGGSPRRIRIVDGLLNLLPADVDPQMQAGFSNLLDAYKTARLVGPHKLGVFALSSVPVDRAEPSEALRANTVRCECAADARVLLTTRQLEAVLRGQPTTEEERARGERCCYLLDRTLEVGAGSSVLVGEFQLEVDLDAAQVLRLAATPPDRRDLTEQTIARIRTPGFGTLRHLARQTDGLCETGQPARDARHLSNTVFNLMRGGTFPLGLQQERDDFTAWLAGVAPRVHARVRGALAAWPARAAVRALGRLAATTDDPDLVRLHREYLPLAFSRRHGDPSRPWNTFSIPARTADGAPRYGYEGNWRDIFQNWEALARSFPAYAQAFVARSVNASTADGYNPYRITRDGVDWEVHDPDDPWSFIGYWGDHQIAYLSRLLQRCEELTPGRLAELLDRAEFVSVDVPYRIRGYDALVADPRDTVVFDAERAREIDALVAEHGNEGKLLRRTDGEVLRQTLADKLLVPFLVKLSNFVPGAGVWMNTQRPEWNDANNALVGQGASMVTACALWSHAGVLADLLDRDGAYALLASTRGLWSELDDVLTQHDFDAVTNDPDARRRFTDAAGRAGERHRLRVYARDFGNREQVSGARVRGFLSEVRRLLATSIRANRRDDGLYHGYNLVTFEGTGRIGIRRLDLMLEAQAAVLGSGFLDGAASADLLDALRQSALYCPRRDGYVLYPDRELAPLEERNALPEAFQRRFPRAAALTEELLAAGHDALVRADDDGGLRFAPGLRNAGCLRRELDHLAGSGPRAATDRERAELLAAYEAVFDHAAFTGRSGTFFGYEGLGCIYWHMVSKLVLATQETLWRHVDGGSDRATTERLRGHYFALRKGLGVEASPADWGAFPTDAYSHTPRDGGAKQPGMTGQVKEDILCHLGELGIRIVDGAIRFDPLLVEFDEARFTLCRTEVSVRRSHADEILVSRHPHGADQKIPGHVLDRAISAEILDPSPGAQPLSLVIFRAPRGSL